MNIILAVIHSDAPIMLKIIFWLLLLLWGIGAFGYRENPRFIVGSTVLLIILFGILGYFVLGF